MLALSYLLNIFVNIYIFRGSRPFGPRQRRLGDSLMCACMLVMVFYIVGYVCGDIRVSRAGWMCGVGVCGFACCFVLQRRRRGLHRVRQDRTSLVVSGWEFEVPTRS